MQVNQKYPQSEISLHSNKKDCWLVIHGKVYDVTTFLEDHPGGDEVLVQASANGDATQSFEDVGHSSTATSMMQGYFIGYVEGYSEENSSSDANKASKTIDNILQKQKQEPTSSYSDLILPLFILAVAFGVWYYLTFINVQP